MSAPGTKTKDGGKWEKVPRRLVDHMSELPPGAVALWLAIRLSQFGPEGKTHKSNRTLGRETGLGQKAVTRFRKLLFEKGWLWFMGYYRRADGTFAGRTMETRAVVPEIAADGSRTIKAPREQHRPAALRSSDGHFEPKPINTDTAHPAASVKPTEQAISAASVEPTDTANFGVTDTAKNGLTDTADSAVVERPFEKDISEKDAISKKSPVPVTSSISLSKTSGERENDEVAVKGFFSHTPPSTKKEELATTQPATTETPGMVNSKPCREKKRRLKAKVNLDAVLAAMAEFYEELTGFDFEMDEEKRYADFYKRKIQQHGPRFVIGAVGAFAESDELHDRMRCPAAILMTRWGDYLEEAEMYLRCGGVDHVWPSDSAAVEEAA